MPSVSISNSFNALQCGYKIQWYGLQDPKLPLSNVSDSVHPHWGYPRNDSKLNCNNYLKRKTLRFLEIWKLSCKRGDAVYYMSSQIWIGCKLLSDPGTQFLIHKQLIHISLENSCGYRLEIVIAYMERTIQPHVKPCWLKSMMSDNILS